MTYVFPQPEYVGVPLETSKTGDVVRAIVEERRVDPHQLLRGPPGSYGAQCRRELVRAVRKIGYAPDAIDRHFGWPVGTSEELLKPRLVPADEAPLPPIVPKERPQDPTRIESFRARPPDAEASRVESLKKVAQARHDRECDERLARSAARRDARLAAEAKAREERAVLASKSKEVRDRAAVDKAERKLERALQREERRIANEARRDAKLKLEAAAELARKTAFVVEVPHIAAAMPPRLDKRVSVMPRCQEERVAGQPCGRMALAWLPSGEPACVYCAVQARQAG